jgi:excisionase family DNA binding protein
MPLVDPAQRTKVTPPQVAERLGVSADKVLLWIRSGELRAVNVATRLDGRPRWRVDLADLMAFEERRSAVPARSAPRCRKKQDAVIEFF